MSSMPSTPDSPPYLVDGKLDAQRYLEGCLDGSIIVCDYVKKFADIMLPRITDGYKQWHLDTDAALRPVRFCERFCRIPSGKKSSQPFILEPYERMPVELAFGFVDDDGNRQIKEVFIQWARKCGKAISLKEILPTPYGWREMGDLHVGDMVFAQDGTPSTIVAESEIFDKPTYLVTFEDGAQIKATNDHIWTVQTKQSRRAMNRKPRISNPNCDHSRLGKHIGKGKRYRDGGWFETTTQEMFDDPCFVHRRADGTGVEYKYRVPLCLPVEYPEKELPIDPYTFGYWLGDGSKTSSCVTVADKDIDEAVRLLESYGHTCIVTTFKDRASNILIDGGRQHVPGSNPFVNALRELGVYDNKHIPDIYLQGSTKQRWELLCGLMDTDGYCSKNGECEFVQKDERMARQFVELCSSLGIKAKLREKDAYCNGEHAGTVYRVLFHTDKEHSCFHLKRKHDRLKDKLASRMSCKTIVSIERIPNEPTKCIAIDNPSHLYLVGRQYTATHNTSLLAALNLYMLLSDNPDERVKECYNAASSDAQARLCYGATDAMANMSPLLSKRLRRGMVQKRGASGLNDDKTGSYLCTVSANGKKLDGLNTFFAVYDELAVCEDGGMIYDLITESMAGEHIKSPQLWIISTENYVRDNIFDERKNYAIGWLDGKIEDDTLLPLVYQLDSRSEIYDERAWIKASPGLGITKSYDYLRERIAKAQQSPARMPSLLCKEFNLRSNAFSSFLDIKDCINETPIDFNEIGIPPYVCLGIDLAVKYDLLACCCRWMVPGDDRIYEIVKFWVSSSVINMQTDAKQKDNVPYLLWSTQGQKVNDTMWHYVEIVDGDRVGFPNVVDFMNELTNEGMYIYCVGYDPWHFGDVETDMLKRYVGETRALPVPPTLKAMSPLIRMHELDLKAHKVICPNPCLHHNRSSVQVREDPQGNVQVQKRDLKPENRIDGFLAETYALAAYNKFKDGYLSAIGWTEPENEEGSDE